MINELYLGIGSNIGDRLENIEKAIKELSSLMEIQKRSSIYETSPWGYEKQPDFLNCVVSGKTSIQASELMKKILEIENKMGRKRKEKFGPRVIDIDILFYGKEIINTTELIIPHLLLQFRKFVLLPMSEINPEFMHPVLEKSIKELLKQLRNNEICKKLSASKK